jgi:hypothetical protein
MRARLVLLALLVACGADAQHVGGDGLGGSGAMGPYAIGDGFPRSGGVTETITDLYDRDFRLDSSALSTSALPTCTAAVGCEMQCRVVSSAWACVDENGTTIAVTAGTGVITVTDPWGRVALDEVTGARAPRLTSAFDAVLAGAHTIVTTAYSTTHVDATYQYTIDTNPGAGSRTQVRQEGGTARELAGTYTAIGPTGASFALGLAMTATVSNAANTTHTFNLNGLTATSGAGAWTDPTTTAWKFGARSSDNAFPLAGVYESVTVYSDDKTAAELETLLNAWAALAEDASSPINHERPGQQFAIVSGRAWPYGWHLPVVTSNGMEIQPNSAGPVNAPPGSGWATDATDADSWTDVGTPTITANQAAGPFAAWRVGPSGNEADLIVDDDAGAREGLEGVLGCGDDQTVTGDYTASCYVRSGTSGTTTTDVTIAVQTNGTGSTECTFTDLTSTFVRKTCYAAVTGSPTSIKGRVLVGDAVGDTGSIIVSQCQCENRGWATAPKPNNETTSSDVWTIPETETDTWPTGETVGGEMEIVWQTDFEHPTQAYDYLMLYDDVNDSGTDHAFLMAVEYIAKDTTPVRGRVGLRPEAHSPSIPDDTDLFFDLPGPLEAGQWYIMRWRFMPAGTLTGIPRVNHYVWYDECADPATCTATTLVGSDTTGTKFASDGTTDIGYFGQRYNLHRGFTGRVARFRVSEVE